MLTKQPKERVTVNINYRKKEVSLYSDSLGICTKQNWDYKIFTDAFSRKHLLQNLSSPMSRFGKLRQMNTLSIHEETVKANDKNHHDNTG